MTGKAIPVSNPMSGRWLRWIRAAWYVAAIVVLTIVALAIPGYIRAIPVGFSVIEFAPNPSPVVLAINAFTALISLSTVLLSLFLAYLLFRRRPDDRMALFLSFFLLGFSVFSGAFEVADPELTGGVSSFLWNLFTNLVAFPAACFLFLLFPDGRFSPAWSRQVALASLVAAALMAISFVVWSGSDTRSLAPLVISSILSVAILLGVLYAQFHRYRHIASGQQKQQIKWLVYGLGMMLFVLIASAAPYYWSFTLPESTPYPIWLALDAALYYLSFAALPLSLTIAVMRHRLYDIDILINRTLVYGALSAIVIGLYVIVVGSLSLLFQTRNNLLISLLVTGLVAVLFQPLREWLQAKVSRLMFGERDNPAIVLARLGEQIEANVALSELLTGILETVSKSLKLPYAAVELTSENSTLTAAEYGRPLDATERLPLVTHGEEIGHLVVSPRSPGHTFSTAERLLLENIARQTGTAVYAGQLYADLQKSREQIVTAREEERRRLRRDLHDGLGSALAALHLQAGAMRSLLTSDPEAADELIVDHQTELRAAVAEIRRMVYDLRPKALDELGLIGAVQARADQCNLASSQKATVSADGGRQRPLRVTVEAPEMLPPLPAAVEVAAFRIVSEALNNVVQHSQAQNCAVRLLLNGHVHLEISDDGNGLPAEPQKGVGLRSMRERAMELGGRCEITSSEKGTRVLVWLPLPKE